MPKRSKKQRAGKRKKAAKGVAVKKQLMIHAAVRALGLAAEDITVNGVRLRAPSSRLFGGRAGGFGVTTWKDKDPRDKAFEWDSDPRDPFRPIPKLEGP